MGVPGRMPGAVVGEGIGGMQAHQGTRAWSALYVVWMGRGGDGGVYNVQCVIYSVQCAM